MAQPVAVLPNPNDPKNHLLFFGNVSKQQLALEQRPVDTSAPYVKYTDYGISNGGIVIPGSLAAVLHWNLVTVYGVSQPGTEANAKRYISKLSPIYNLIANSSGKPFEVTQKALAACSNDVGKNFIYYLTPAEGGNSYQITELAIDYLTGIPTVLETAIPSSDTNLASVYFPATKDRFVFYYGLAGKKHYLWYISANSPSAIHIDNTGDANKATPLAVTSTSGNDANGPYLHVFLYYMDTNYQLNRVVGTARGTNIAWKDSQGVAAPPLQDNTLMAVTTDGQDNYVYYLQDGQPDYIAYKDLQTPEWFEPPRKET